MPPQHPPLRPLRLPLVPASVTPTGRCARRRCASVRGEAGCAAVAMCVCGWQAGVGSLLPCSAARIPQIAKQKKREAKARREAEAAEIRKRLDELVRGCLQLLVSTCCSRLTGGCVCLRQKPLDDPVAERERRRKLVEDADHALTEELFADGASQTATPTATLLAVVPVARLSCAGACVSREERPHPDAHHGPGVAHCCGVRILRQRRRAQAQLGRCALAMFVAVRWWVRVSHVGGGPTYRDRTRR